MEPSDVRKARSACVPIIAGALGLIPHEIQPPEPEGVAENASRRTEDPAS